MHALGQTSSLNAYAQEHRGLLGKVGLTGFVVLEGINPEALKTGADPADEGLRYAGRYYYRDPETGKLFSEVEGQPRRPESEESFQEALRATA